MTRTPGPLRKKSGDEPRLIDTLNIPLGQPVDLAVWAVKKTGIRCKLIPTGEPITYRMIRDEVDGEIITVKPSKIWQYKNTVYMTGETISRRLDVGALGLKPLGLKDEGVWEPDNETDLVGEDDPFEKYYLPILAYGPRHEFEMEQVIPLKDPSDWESDPIVQASEIYECGNYPAAFKIIADVLSEDVRCLDAHAHLGNWVFNVTEKHDLGAVKTALRHYEAGLRIGELSLPKNFYGLLPWAFLDNRPFLRCLHGYGLCLWRSGNATAARDVFERMLWLNPRDNQGARYLLADIDTGIDWYQSAAEDAGI